MSISGHRMSTRLRQLGPCLSQRCLGRHKSRIDLYSQDTCDEISCDVFAFPHSLCHLLLLCWTESGNALCHLLAHLASENGGKNGVRQANYFQSFGERPPVKPEVRKVTRGHANTFVDETTQVLNLLDPGGGALLVLDESEQGAELRGARGIDLALDDRESSHPGGQDAPASQDDFKGGFWVMRRCSGEQHQRWSLEETDFLDAFDEPCRRSGQERRPGNDHALKGKEHGFMWGQRCDTQALHEGKQFFIYLLNVSLEQRLLFRLSWHRYRSFLSLEWM